MDVINFAYTNAGEVVRLGTTPRFQLFHASKDKLPWDLTGATILIRFTRPDYTIFTQPATITNATSGTAEYVCTTSDLNMVGQWNREWLITQGPLTLVSVEDIPFKVR